MEDWVYLPMKRNVRTRVNIKTMAVEQSGPGLKFYRAVTLTIDMVQPLALRLTSELFK